MIWNSFFAVARLTNALLPVKNETMDSNPERDELACARGIVASFMLGVPAWLVVIGLVLAA